MAELETRAPTVEFLLLVIVLVLFFGLFKYESTTDIAWKYIQQRTGASYKEQVDICTDMFLDKWKNIGIVGKDGLIRRNVYKPTFAQEWCEKALLKKDTFRRIKSRLSDDGLVDLSEMSAYKSIVRRASNLELEP